MSPTPSIHRLRGSAIAVVFWRLVGIGSNVLLTLLLARTLPEGELRDYSLFISFLSVGAIFAAFGQNESALRFIAEHMSLGNLCQAAQYWRAARSITFISALVAAGCVCAFLLVDDWRLGESLPQATLFLTMFLGIALLAWQMVAAESLRGYQEIRLASLFSGGLAGGPLSSLLLLMAVALLALLGQLTLGRVLTAYVVAIGLTLPIPLLLLARRSKADLYLSTQPSPPATTITLTAAIKVLLAVGFILMLTQLLSFALQSADMWIGGRLLAKVDLDHYFVAKRIVLLIAMPVQMATLTVISSIPDLYAQRKLKELQHLLQTTAMVAALPSILASLPLLFFPQWTLGFILGERFITAAPCLQILVVGYLVLVISGNPQQALTMTGFHKVAMLVNLLSCIVLVGLGYWLTQQQGVNGLATAAAVSLSLQNLLLWGLAKRLTGVWTHLSLTPFLTAKR